MSSYFITFESNVKVMRINEMITNERSSCLLIRFCVQYCMKCVKDSMENIDSDVRV